MHPEDHWNRVYATKGFDSVSWYAPHLDKSLKLIERLCPDKAAAIVDIGGGQSTLVDDLLHAQYRDISVLDISRTAIEFTKRRLGERSEGLSWHVGDISRYDFGAKQFDLWHDRAVFHFLTDVANRMAYVGAVRRSVKPGGHVVIATFGPDGPFQCSGLDVVRYDDKKLQQAVGDGFVLLGSETTYHQTPMGKEQQFLYSWFKVDA